MLCEPLNPKQLAFRAFFYSNWPLIQCMCWCTRIHTCTFPAPVSEALLLCCLPPESQAPNTSGWVIWPERAPGLLSVRGHTGHALTNLSNVGVPLPLGGRMDITESIFRGRPWASFCQAQPPFHSRFLGCSQPDDGSPALPSRFGRSFIRHGQFLAGKSPRRK